MRKFSSYGPIDKDIHYYVPRKELIESAYQRLIGEKPEKGGHYITVWAPRQAGKTWIMQQVVRKLREQGDFEVAIISMQSAKTIKTDEGVLKYLVKRLGDWFDRKLPEIDSWDHLTDLFSKEWFEKPLILILDEFDALRKDFINKFANEFRDIHIRRQNEMDIPSDKKNCLLHGLALIGVRSVLGIENVSGSPFNVQRSVHIPNLTYDETAGMFEWYEKESGQKIERDVVERLFYETRGQPGLVGWLGELLTETYNKEKDRPITMANFEHAFLMATDALPNNNVVNIISKAGREKYEDIVLELFKTNKKMIFKYDKPRLNYLYMNGVTDIEETGGKLYVRFSSPFIQKRLFGYFSEELFEQMGKLHEPFEDLGDTFLRNGLDIRNLMRRFEGYIKKNRGWLLKDAPRRKDLRIYEAVFHFNLYRFIFDFLYTRHGQVHPEFSTGNGKVDLIIKLEERMYAIEVKSYTDERGYDEALLQAARYGKQLKLSEISLVFFVETIDDANRAKYEKDYKDEETGVRVLTVFVETGS